MNDCIILFNLYKTCNQQNPQTFLGFGAVRGATVGGAWTNPTGLEDWLPSLWLGGIGCCASVWASPIAYEYDKDMLWIWKIYMRHFNAYLGNYHAYT